jgi:hypothetical protein
MMAEATTETLEALLKGVAKGIIEPVEIVPETEPH